MTSSTETDTNKQIIHTFVEAINTADYDALHHLLAPNFSRHCQATPDVRVESVQDLIQFDKDSRQTFPDQKVCHTQLVAENNCVAFWAEFTGTQKGPLGPFPATGKSVAVDFCGVFTLDNSKILSVKVTWDNVTLLRQLGLAPPM